ncbi:MAG: Flp pilus assembly complex ATPase component [Alphaproteobacteria bacterium]|nr:Flp pilus assembly complex ATPase component [Alphaproteobacteria bacterium]
MKTLKDIQFSDIWITPNKKIFIPDDNSNNGLVQLEGISDINIFVESLEKNFNNKISSYSIVHDGVQYRVERVKTINGIQYSSRRMPKRTPDITTLGYSKKLLKVLLSLSNSSGLILIGGSTGNGKTTAISSLLKAYLLKEGGFAYTIEDPPEMPLDGIYKNKTGVVGLCKQTIPPNNKWGEGLKSALRSRPKFILVGEIRTPDTANEVLRAATSGHLVLSTIHANSVEDCITSIIKYASSTSMTEELSQDLLSRGVLSVIHQELRGTGLHKTPSISCLFANPTPGAACPIRVSIKSGDINLSTHLEAQTIKLMQGKSLWNNNFNISQKRI